MKIVPLLLLVSATVFADSYTEGCVKMLLFHLKPADVSEQVKAQLRRGCECQGRELKKRGVTDEELAAFTKNAGEATLDTATRKVAPRINGILQSAEVTAACPESIP